MKTTVTLILVVLGCAAAEEFFDDQTALDDSASQARFLYFNSSSTATSLTLLGAIILLGVIAYLVYAGGLLGSNGFNRHGYDGPYYDQSYDGHYHNQYRSNDASYADFDVLNVLRWIQVLQEMYSDFDYNDLECQKKIICEVMKEPEYFGSAAQKFKTGFRYARYLEAFSLPDDLRELLDEYMDADARSEQGKECTDFFQCPYSLKDSVVRNVSNDLQ